MTLLLAIGPALFAGVAVGVALMAIGQSALALCAFGFAMFLVTVIVHEFGHVLAYRITQGPEAPATILTNGLSVRFRRRRGTRRQDVWTIISGPLAPMALLPLSLVLIIIHPLLTLGWSVFSFGHAVMLLVPVGDGAALYSRMRD